MSKKKELSKKKMTKDNGVSLSNYINEVCKEILIGVIKAQSDKDFGKYIGCTPVSGEHKDEAGNIISYVEFSVTAEVFSSINGHGEVKVPVIGELGGEYEKKRSDLNRVEFSIPIVIPSPKEQLELRKRIETQDSEPYDGPLAPNLGTTA